MGFLFAHGTAIVASEILEYNTVMYIFLFVLVGFFTVVYGVYPISMRMQKATLFAVGIVCIFV
ncbi:hypothetical protein GW750_09100 [bacterium]|nr:hypothetical protein [bacterium]